MIVCDQCGAERPRSGLCPECGAPPPGTYSSMREWRGRGSPNESTRRGGNGGSGSSWRAGSSGRGRSGGNWQGSGGDWQDQGYDDTPPAGRSNRRNRRPADDYDEVDLDRALVPARNDMMAPMDAGAGLPAMAGAFPQTDEEERSLGMRRPAYIPATNEKRKRKLSSWRVISGVLSVMLACIATCAAAGILGRDKFNTFFGPPIKVVQTPVTVDLSNIPVTPVATPGPAAKSLTLVTTALHRQGNCSPVDPTSRFHYGDTVWVFVVLKTSQPGHKITVRWYMNGNAIQPPQTGPGHTEQDLTGTSAGGACFGIPIPSVGTGMARLYWDLPANDTSDSPTDPALMATINFAILPVGYGTPTPGAAGTPQGTPQATPKPSPTTAK